MTPSEVERCFPVRKEERVTLMYDGMVLLFPRHMLDQLDSVLAADIQIKKLGASPQGATCVASR